MENIYYTVLFSSVFCLFYLFLSFRIGYMRGSPVTKLFFKTNKKITEQNLHRNVRAHGNFSEYVPLFIILILLSEILQTLPKQILLIVCLLFTYGRFAHAICFAFFESNPFLRISGMLFTYFGLLFFSFNLLWHFFLYSPVSR